MNNDEMIKETIEDMCEDLENILNSLRTLAFLLTPEDEDIDVGGDIEESIEED